MIRGYWDKKDARASSRSAVHAEAVGANLFEHWWERLSDDEIHEELANGSRPDFSFVFDHDLSASVRVRSAIQPMLEQHEICTIAFDVGVVANELVTNVVEHTVGGGRVQAWGSKQNRPFRLEVSDTSCAPLEPPEFVSEGAGRGLRIVERLSDAWGVDLLPQGKQIWAEFGRGL